MNKFVLIFGLFAVLSVGRAAQIRASCPVNCSNLPNGEYANPEECGSFCFCENGASYKLECPSGLFYNGLSKSCVMPSRSGCIQGSSSEESKSSEEKPTTRKTTTTTKKGSDSDSDSNSSEEKPTTTRKPTPTTTTTTTTTTKKPTQAPTDAPTEAPTHAPTHVPTNAPEPDTEGPVEPEPDTEAPVEPEPETESPVEPEPETEAPVEPEPETESPVEPEDPTEAPEDPETPAPEPKFCDDKECGIYSDPKNCKRFYQCKDGVTIRHRCPSLLGFNPRVSSCDYLWNSNCKSTRL